jgi:ribosomal protein S12 methylthiotransferase accessory factor
VVLLNITTDVGVPSILAVLQGRECDAPALVFAAATDMDPEKAVRKSLEELAHTRQLAQQLKRTQPPIDVKSPYDTITDKDHHVHLYCDQSSLPLAQFLFASQARCEFGGIESLAGANSESNLEILQDKVRDTGHRVYVSDLTTSDVDSLGLRVVRAIIPGFHPLFMGHSLRALGGSRLWQVPQRLDYRGIMPSGGDNPAPHPYP